MKNHSFIKFMEQQKGYASTKEILSKGAKFSQIEELLQEGRIERLKRGLYRLSTASISPIREFVDLTKAVSKGVICLYSALSHYGLTTFVPNQTMIAMPQGYHAPKLEQLSFQVFHFSQKQYEAGMEIVQAPEGSYKIYTPEKSVCDAFRFRKKWGEDTAKEALFNYLEGKKKRLKKLLEMAEVCRMSKVMQPYIEARIG